MTYNGLVINLFSNGQPLVPSGFGHIGKFNAGDMIDMQMSFVGSSEGRLLLTTNAERRDVKRLTERKPSEGSYYAHTVPVIPGKPLDQTDIQKNCVHLVDMDDDGIIQVTNIVIIMQKGEFYLICQPTYRVQAFKSKLGVAVPALWGEAGFADLVPLIQEHYKSRSHVVLQPESAYQPAAEIDTSRLPDNNHLVVKFWSVRKGTGVAVRKDGELVKIYWGNIVVNPGCPAHLIESEMVRAANYRHPFGKSSLSFEAVGVARVEFNADAAA